MRRIVFIIIAVVVLIAALAYLRKKPADLPAVSTVKKTKPNILLLTLDTLRPDHLGAYGYSKIQTPALDRLAQNGVLFQQAVCQTPLTLVSHSS
ncbi:MAG TPA: sulfatase-like hydrolase/transferase, partial [Acidobacteriota bacterium]|nr:sulfatase-like hydrolase/transferase [Acidobacteriota bacterium]